jgi:hypothetical protein
MAARIVAMMGCCNKWCGDLPHTLGVAQPRHKTTEARSQATLPSSTTPVARTYIREHAHPNASDLFRKLSCFSPSGRHWPRSAQVPKRHGVKILSPHSTTLQFSTRLGGWPSPHFLVDTSSYDCWSYPASFSAG